MRPFSMYRTVRWIILSFIIPVSIFFAIFLLLFIQGGIYLYGGIFMFSVYTLCNASVTLIGLQRYIPETVVMNDSGIKITKWRKIKEARWEEISQVCCQKSKWYPPIVKSSVHYYYCPIIVIISKNWKHTITGYLYGEEPMIKVFRFIVERIGFRGNVIIDTLGWLPSQTP